MVKITAQNNALKGQQSLAWGNALRNEMGNAPQNRNSLIIKHLLLSRISSQLIDNQEVTGFGCLNRDFNEISRIIKNSVNLSVSSVSLCETKTITRSYTEKTQSCTEKNLVNLENLTKILVQDKIL